LLGELARIDVDEGRSAFLAAHPELKSPAAVRQLSELVVEKIRVDTREAVRLADAALAIANELNQKEGLALASRAKANALYASGNHREAVEHHERAFKLYEELGNLKEAGRTLSSSIQPLILLGEYDRAFAASERAREIFTRRNEPWRLARLEINVGNIFHRQDRFEEALAYYERATEVLAQHQDAEAMAVVLSNTAVCLISLNDFPRALAIYQRAREVCEKNSMPLLVAQADYNIAYLYYLRGEYSRAIEILYEARRKCEATGDAYHFALCHLDLSDVYLELNLSEEARETAHEGSLQFEKLGLVYEAAKTLSNEATACGQQGKSVQALELFAKAREMFAREKNLVWPWLLDLYQALLLFWEGRHFEARRLAIAAAQFFDQSILHGKAVLAHLLLARIALKVDDSAAAEIEINAVFAKLERSQTPVLAYEAHFLRGEICQKRGDCVAAHAAYKDARKALEALRGQLRGEELKISFVKNRMQVYEALVDLLMSDTADASSAEEAFSCIEAAKSRNMIEMIFRSGQSLPMGDSGQSGLVRRIRDLREELNWYYHRIELEQLRPEERSEQRIQRLQEQVQSRENELIRTLRELPAHERENATLEAPAEFSLQKVQASLPRDTALIEYYSVGDRVVAAVLHGDSVEIVPVTLMARVQHFLRLLRFQLSKFRMGMAAAQGIAEPLLRATQSHLHSLYGELIAPLRARMRSKHLIFVPHGPLHFLPFHALLDGEEYLADAYTVSYAPSATVFAVCQEKPARSRPASLVLGVPDDRAPEILGEVQSVAALLPESKLLLGVQANSGVLREQGAQCGLLHIATHGVYRQDNPMFSGIRLGDGYLNLYDLYQLRLGADLVTLSGCATGMNVVAAGDELLGLQRGLFCAGAASLLLSLWDVHDRSTTLLMQSFYKAYIETGDMPASLQSAMRELRDQNPHPYFWAPFVLVGKLADSKSFN
jgi:CHAT domain-containing protein/tetratricopeptide (TPR) repeat protein